MRRWSVALAFVLAAGCLSAPAPETPAASEALVSVPSEAAAIDAVPQPGLYDLSPAGLKPVDNLAGLTWEIDAAGTHYSLDPRESLLENTEILWLVQALEDQDVPISFDIDVTYRPNLPLGDQEGSDLVCIGTSIMYAEQEHGFYFDRAAGRPGTPPTVDEYGGFQGAAVGHGRAGPILLLEQLYGNRFQESDQSVAHMKAGEFLRIGDALSQYPPLATMNEGSHWWQNFTLPGAHRILRIPTSPLFCANGFGQFEDAEITGASPFRITRGGHREIETRYGASAALNLYTPRGDPGPDPNPANSATVDFLGKTCSAGPGKSVVLSSFDAGVIAIQVQQWVGEPVVIMSGMAQGQALWASYGGKDVCQA